MKKSCVLTISVAAIIALAATSSANAARAPFTGERYIALSDSQKMAVVAKFKEQARRDGVIIRKDNAFYCDKLDTFYGAHPDYGRQPFHTVMKTLAIMEYDWQKKGVDKDALARQWLGDELYNANRARLGKK